MEIRDAVKLWVIRPGPAPPRTPSSLRILGSADPGRDDVCRPRDGPHNLRCEMVSAMPVPTVTPADLGASGRRISPTPHSYS